MLLKEAGGGPVGPERLEQPLTADVKSGAVDGASTCPAEERKGISEDGEAGGEEAESI